MHTGARGDDMSKQILEKHLSPRLQSEQNMEISLSKILAYILVSERLSQGGNR